jgi:hypothetical protein
LNEGKNFRGIEGAKRHHAQANQLKIKALLDELNMPATFKHGEKL